MSQTGIVTSWRGPFGFVELEDKTAVYVATEDIDGGRLRVGRTVTFDTEEGKEGKLKGVNVKGEGVLAKGTELSEEDKAEDRKKAQEFRESKTNAAKEEMQPVWDKVEKLALSNQVTLLKKLSSMNGGKLEAKYADPTQKGSKKFTKGEFLAFYGNEEGNQRWKQVSSGKPKKRITRE
ncbi:hypothetical protein DIPPA_12097 [Diplonema papillatum]|nr:hypothetical protein DIPPA_12097 [Diplonema papillatum]KAJ9470892.1 hypothetical protein DIPPA_12097 [Diplonema papillatum]